MAESELAVLSTQCLDRRIADKQTLTEEVAAWQDRRNKHHAKADWQFTTADARIKLKRLTRATSKPNRLGDGLVHKRTGSRQARSVGHIFMMRQWLTLG
jgi:hypothetical protein